MFVEVLEIHYVEMNNATSYEYVKAVIAKTEVYDISLFSTSSHSPEIAFKYVAVSTCQS